MPRKIRIQYPGAVYHVTNHGGRRQAIFRGAPDYELFLRTMEQACQKALWQVHAYCLLPRHIHLVIQTPQPTLVAGMKWLLGTYAARLNRRHRQSGHVFSGRYKALVVDDQSDGCLKTVCDYVHLNPARARLLPSAKSLEAFRWSSYPLYLANPRRRPPWLRVDKLLGQWHIPKDNAAGRRKFGQAMERRRREDLTKDFRPVERGWCLGGKEFRRGLLEQMTQNPGGAHYGEAVQESVEVRAERQVKGQLKAMGWTEKDLLTRRKGHADKVKLAAAVRAQTTMSLEWIAARLRMGSRGYLASLLLRHKKKS